MTDINLSIKGKDEGAGAILKLLQQALSGLTKEQLKSLGVTVKQKTELQELVATQNRSASAARAAARSHAAVVESNRQAAAAARDAAAATRQQTQAMVVSASQGARAQQQATQAAIASARQHTSVLQDQTRAIQQQTQAQITASAQSARATQQATQQAIQQGRIDARQVAQQTGAIFQQTQQIATAARQAVQASNQQTQTIVNNSRQVVTAMGQQTQASLAASRAAQQAANNAANASRAQASAVAGRARVQATQIRTQADVQIAQLRLQQEIIRGNNALRVAQVQQSQVSQQQGSIVGALTRRFLGLFAALRGAVAFRDFVHEGLEFNSIIEQATLGIASLITAQSKLYDNNGVLVEGQQALTRAMYLSEQQMTKLRIEGLRTAATTEQLVTAFQQGVGPGLGAGLNLDQIRELTVVITQAAGAIGLPMHQLNEEIRSLLAGTITYNTRIAKTLGITNQMVDDWKAQGTLAENLLQRFNAFNLAGEKAMNNMAVMKSNMQEAFAVFAGASVRPLFDQFKVAAQAGLNRLFDFDRGTINAKFQGIVDIAREVFSGIGAFIARAITGGVNAVQRLSAYFEENRAQIRGIVEATGEFVTQVGRVLGGLLKVLATMIDVGIRSGFIEGFFRSLAKITEVVANNIRIVAAILGTIAVNGSIAAIMSLAALGPVAAGITLVVTALGLLAGVMSQTADETTRLNREQEIARDNERKGASYIHRLATEYDVLATSVESGKLSLEQANAAHKRMAELQKELVAISPTFRTQIQSHGHAYAATAEEARKLAHAQMVLLRSQFELTQEHKRGLQEQIRQEQAIKSSAEASARAAEAKGDTRANRKFAEQNRALAEEAQGRIDNLGVQLKRVNAEMGEVLNAVAVTLRAEDELRSPTKIVPNPRGDTKEGSNAKAANDFKQEIEARIADVKDVFARAKESLDTALDTQQISFQDYVSGILTAERTALMAEFRLRNELLARTSDAGERAKIEQEMGETLRRWDELQGESTRKRAQLEKDLAREVQDVRVQQLRNEGKVAEARALELAQQFETLRRTLTINKRDTTFIDRFVNVEVAKAQLDEVRGVVDRAQSALTARLQQIDNLRDQGLLTAGEQARQTGEAYGEVITQINRVLPAMRAFAAASGNPEAIQNVRALEQELARLQIEQRRVSDQFFRIGEAGRRGLEEGLSDVLANLGKDITTVKDALLGLAQSIVDAMQKEVADQLAQTLTTEIVRAMQSAGEKASDSFLGAFVRGLASWVANAFEAVFGNPIAQKLGGLFGRGNANGEQSPAAAVASSAADAGAQMAAASVADAAIKSTQDAAATSALIGATTALFGAATAITTTSATSSVALSGSAAALGASAFALTTSASALTAAAAAMGGNSLLGIVPRHATGGPVRPQGVADPVLIHAEQGEYVHTIAAHRYYGTRLMDAINRQRVPRETLQQLLGATRVSPVNSPRTARYASGGPVQSVIRALPAERGASTARVSGGIALEVAAAEGTVISGLRSRNGEQAIIDVLHRNRESLRAVFGVG